jgi:hypothetical protein
MTVPRERTEAILRTRQFLLLLTDPVESPGVPERIRERALSLLKHYPTEYDLLAMTATASDPQARQ